MINSNVICSSRTFPIKMLINVHISLTTSVHSSIRTKCHNTKFSPKSVSTVQCRSNRTTNVHTAQQDSDAAERNRLHIYRDDKRSIRLQRHAFTNPVRRSPLEASTASASQISRTLWNPRIYYRGAPQPAVI
jgi:hypothetical protein